MLVTHTLVVVQAIPPWGTSTRAFTVFKQPVYQQNSITSEQPCWPTSRQSTLVFKPNGGWQKYEVHYRKPRDSRCSQRPYGASGAYRACQNLNAQATDGNLVGTVVDQTGAAVPGAAVEITNTATGVKSTTTTNMSGEYRFNNILVGNYDIKIARAGFTDLA